MVCVIDFLFADSEKDHSKDVVRMAWLDTLYYVWRNDVPQNYLAIALYVRLKSCSHLPGSKPSTTVPLLGLLCPLDFMCQTFPPLWDIPILPSPNPNTCLVRSALNAEARCGLHGLVRLSVLAQLTHKLSQFWNFCSSSELMQGTCTSPENVRIVL